ncbi:lipase 1-like [Macrosteles quadrilineatus]|uniref:lipase 1-like n=1 Tax=Macrosteles quadrilineatus TaxID=74068 RepID=UPI0023E2B190|nr:lipase 1-like [Macrosteles quadrilineatus]
MSSIYLALALILTFSLNFSLVISDDEDLDVKGPLMFKNPDGSLMTTKQQIEARKYSGESHTVTTDDGYLLTLFRVIPAKQPATVVLLQHALLMSSDAWVTDNKSLAFTLTDAGYDVWMANSRGNCYSRKHTTFDPDKDKSFWNFGLHELGTKDLPAVIDYILKTTGQTKLHLAAHSGGNSMAFAMASQKPEYNDKLKSLQALSPFVFVSKMAEMIGPDGMVEAMTAQYIDQIKAADKWEMFPRKDFVKNNKTQVTCEDVEENYRSMCSEKMEMVHEILGGAYIPAGQSTKAVLHFYQIGVAGVMNYYKFDTPEENEKAYGTKEPPSYTKDFKNITAPTILWTGEHDGLIQTQDVDNLKPLLGNLVADYRIPDDCFDISTFNYARKVACSSVRERVYKELIESLKKFD